MHPLLEDVGLATIRELRTAMVTKVTGEVESMLSQLALNQTNYSNTLSTFST